ncbi:hypothetical protein PR048_022351 [Dryococelus australis]|uniref:Uncharacterized protein n=1 Tax=Dryococelus australis TaxID=614101 RepID=A0ABQ9H0T5_9NEOP|nr:hypothetical protein PR048_022351 [Dryococelus australis]
MAGKKRPFNVIELTQEDFCDYASLLRTNMQMTKSNEDGEKFVWKQPTKVLYKTSLKVEDTLSVMDMTRRQQPHPQTNDVVTISEEKNKNLLSLLPYIPLVFHECYKNLKTEMDLTDTICDSDDEVSMKQRRNAKAGETGEPRINPLASSSGENPRVTPQGFKSGSHWWEASSLTATLPRKVDEGARFLGVYKCHISACGGAGASTLNVCRVHYTSPFSLALHPTLPTPLAIPSTMRQGATAEDRPQREKLLSLRELILDDFMGWVHEDLNPDPDASPVYSYPAPRGGTAVNHWFIKVRARVISRLIPAVPCWSAAYTCPPNTAPQRERRLVRRPPLPGCRRGLASRRPASALPYPHPTTGRRPRRPWGPSRQPAAGDGSRHQRVGNIWVWLTQDLDGNNPAQATGESQWESRISGKVGVNDKCGGHGG